MKNVFLHITLFCCICVASSAQNLDNQGGVINNLGKIKTKSVRSESNGTVENEGTLYVEGVSIIEQDTIDGRVEYTGDNDTQIQYFEPMVYKEVVFSGRGEKQFRNQDEDVVSRELFETEGGGVELQIPESQVVRTEGSVVHRGMINRSFRYGRLILGGTDAQDVSGDGTFKVLQLSNSSGADVVETGGFVVHSTLELFDGELRNSASNNFSMGDNGALIIRSDRSSIAFAPVFGSDVSVTYIGSNNILAGEELPTDPTILQNLRVETPGGLTLAKDVTVNDTLYLAGVINTDPDASRFVLTHTSIENPEFVGEDTEIRGSVRRTSLVTGDGNRNVFNNPYTYAEFENTAALGDIAVVTYRVLPDTVPLPLGAPAEEKVRRTLQITASDSQGDSVVDGFNATVGLGFKVADADERNGLNADSVLLEHWEDNPEEGQRWRLVGAASDVQLQGKWAATRTANLTDFFNGGFYALGRGDSPTPAGVLLARVLLEGPFRNGSMQDDLWQEDLLPSTPPDIYPYNLDPARASIVMGEISKDTGIIDWVVVEFRTLMSGGESVYRTGLLRTDGSIVNYRDGFSRLTVDSGSYYIVVHHRNHLAVMTADPADVVPVAGDEIDFTQGATMLAGTSGGRLVAVSESGRQYFAMFAGDIVQDGAINVAGDRRDYDAGAESAWQQHDEEGYRQADADLNGIVTTRDANVSWNNRERETAVPD